MNVGKYAKTVFGAATPEPVRQMQKKDDKSFGLTVPQLKYEFLPAVGGGVLGAVGWKKHRVLGFFVGSALAGNVYPAVKGQYGRALCGVVPAVGGAMVSVHFKKWYTQALGFVGGSLASGLACSGVRYLAERK